MIDLIGYHGTSIENAHSILTENRFRPSKDNESLRMGEGAYFFSRISEKGDYSIKCAKEIAAFNHKKGKIANGYGILSCHIQCSEQQFLDLFDPENLELFHMMRYKNYEEHIKRDPDFKYERTSVADCEVFDILRKKKGIAVIRCPQFFGMFPREEAFKFKTGYQYPKTFVPNIINICADVNLVTISNIKLIEEGEF